MSRLGKALERLMNPRAELDHLPGFASAGSGSPGVDAPVATKGRFRLRDIFANVPLALGGAILSALFLIVLFGPLFAPYNPYISGRHIVPHFDLDLGEWISPPLAPSTEYLLGTDQWGNDILSMLLYGARNTLVACAFITMVRVLLGLILGAIAGWNEGELSDQVVMGSIGVIASVPLLISSMLLIFALDIRRGLPVFIIALSILGWTEIAQYIRSEFLVLRNMAYIEGARAVGARNFAIAIRHVLPNLLPQLLVITFLEFGAVLMLLGELSFVGVFVGGGSRIATGDELTGVQVISLPEVPEWGAMLAQGYRWLQSKPFIVFPPAMAFFISVVGFNAFGEGLRRLIEQYHLSTNFLLRKRMVLVLGSVSLATVFIINNTGPAPWFANLARSFSGESSLVFTQSLLAIENRSAGSPGSEEAAQYIASQFEALGLMPGWKGQSYIYRTETVLVEPVELPELALLAPDGTKLKVFQHQLEYGFVVQGHGGSGQVQAPVTFVGFEQIETPIPWSAFQGLNLQDQIVLLLQDNAPSTFVEEALIRGAAGVLWISHEHPDGVRSQNQLTDDVHDSLRKPELPIFRIQPNVANQILSHAGFSLSQLLEDRSERTAEGPGWFTLPIGADVSMVLTLDEPRTVSVPNVLGFIHGSDFAIGNQMVVLFTSYDALPTEPSGGHYPGANRSGSGLGIMLETARIWQEQSLNPRRSVLFVAWGGSELERSGAKEFLGDPDSFRHLPAYSSNTRLGTRVLVQLEYLGSGGEVLLIDPDVSSRMMELFETSAIDTGIPIQIGRSGRSTDELLRIPGVDWLFFAWEGSAIPPAQDTEERLDIEKMQLVGEALSRALTVVVRESRY